MGLSLLLDQEVLKEDVKKSIPVDWNFSLSLLLYHLPWSYDSLLISHTKEPIQDPAIISGKFKMFHKNFIKSVDTCDHNFKKGLREEGEFLKGV